MAEPALPLVLPDWELPAGVFACVTTRLGGSSTAPWDSCNLGLHVGDDSAAVEANRKRLQAELEQRCSSTGLRLQWLQQVHGTRVLCVETATPVPPPEADAAYTRASGIACAVLTADCLPVLFCSADGKELAVAHAGWRGLVGGVLERTLASFQAPPQQILAWLGPAIAACHFEVGAEVRARFLEQAPTAAQAATDAAFRFAADGKYLADLYQLARLRLQAAGLTRISGQPRCTVCDARQWYSYRRDGVTGRFASLILRCR